MMAEDPYTSRRVTAVIGLELGGLLFDSDGNEVGGSIVVGLETVGVAGPPNAVRCITVKTRGTPRIDTVRMARLKAELVDNLRSMPGGEFVKIEAVVAAIEEIVSEAQADAALMDPDDLVLCVPLNELRELLRGDLPMTGIPGPQ